MAGSLLKTVPFVFWDVSAKNWDGARVQARYCKTGKNVRKLGPFAFHLLHKINCGSVFGRREAGVPAGIPTLRLERCIEFRRFQSIRHDYIRHSSMAGPIGSSSAFAVAVLLTIQYYCSPRGVSAYLCLCLSVCRIMCAMVKRCVISP